MIKKKDVTDYSKAEAMREARAAKETIEFCLVLALGILLGVALITWIWYNS